MNVLLKFLPLILGAITGTMRDMLKELVDKLEEYAKTTDNPVDDIFVAFLKALLNID